MKTTKLIIGIISIVLFVIIMFQSCATGLVNAFDNNSEDTSATGGVILAFIMLIAGIVAIAAGKSKGGSITAGVMYVMAAIFGFASIGVFKDLVIWSSLALAFGLIIIIGSIKMKKNTDEPKD